MSDPTRELTEKLRAWPLSGYAPGNAIALLLALFRALEVSDAE